MKGNLGFSSMLLSLACLFTTRQANADGGAWNVPGDLAELQQTCSQRPGLQTFCRSGYLGIECGYQAVLLGSKLPIAPAPHIPWAKPYARGPIKTLFISAFGNAPAETEQLAQVTRELEIDARWVLVADAAITAAPDELYATQHLPEQARAALRESYDVIVMTLGTATPHYGHPRTRPYFPDDVYRTILRKVEQGSGLVLVGQFNGGYWPSETPLVEALPASMTGGYRALDGEAASFEPAPGVGTFATLGLDPAWFTKQTPLVLYDWRLKSDATVLATNAGGRPLVMARNHGKGRVVLLGWDGTLLPHGVGREPMAAEYCSAIALRALAFAAHKEPPVRLTLAPTTLQAGLAGSVRLHTTAAARLSYVLRDPAFHQLAATTVALRPGDNALTLPALPNGRYWLELTARDPRGRSLAWGTHAIQVEAPWSLTLRMDREAHQVGDTVRIASSIAGSPPVPAHAFELEVRDAADRVLAIERFPATGNATQLTYRVRDARVAPHTATVTVYAGDVPLLRASARFFVPPIGWSDYENILWPLHATSPINGTMRDEAGVTAVFESHGRDLAGEVAARFGMRVARLNDAMLVPGDVQTVPWRAASDSAQNLLHAVRAARRYGALAWVFQDERHQLADAGPPDAESLRRFRTYLRAQYPSLAALNASWDTQYTSWDQAQPMLSAALKPGTRNLAPWVDFRLYVADAAFQVDKRNAHMVRAALGHDPPIGIDGFTTSGHLIPYGGLDFGRLAAEGVFDFYAPYADDFVFASLVQGPKAKYLGWSMSRDEYFGLPWRDAFRGYAGTLRFFGPTLYSDFGWPQPAGRWTGEGTRELRHGVGKLLLGSVRRPAPVTILYSYRSMITASMAHRWSSDEKAPGLFPTAVQSRAVLERMLLGAGVSFAYQTEDEVGAGNLKGTKLLIIPMDMGMALGPKTTAAIQQFVNAGGTVLADVAPAAFDEHGKLQHPGRLDALFGVERARFELVHPSLDYGARIASNDPLVPPLGAGYVDAVYEAQLRVTDGRALGSHMDAAPAFIAKRTGAGQTLLLNFPLYTWFASALLEPAQYALMARVLEAAGVQPHLRIESSAGARQTHCEVNRFEHGRNEYVGVYAQRSPVGDPSGVQAHFEEPRETYEVRSEKYLGKVRSVPLPLRAGEAALYARLDYKLTALKLSARRDGPGQPVLVDIRLDASAPPDRHVVRAEVLQPDGKLNSFYTTNVVVSAGQGQLQFMPALNDVRGTWRVLAREVVSGLRAEASIRLE